MHQHRLLLFVASLVLSTSFIEELIISKAFAHELTKYSWNQFRGPTANGKSPSENLPTEWNETRNIRWKKPITGKAWSSPVISGDTIWLSNATEDGRRLFLLAINLKNGVIRKDITVFDFEDRDVFAYNSIF